MARSRRAPFEPLIVNDTIYRTKISVQTRCSEIFRRGVVSQEDEPFLASLLSRHRSAAQKIGCGVKRFYVGKDHYNKPCFWLERLDGSRTDWSSRACITPPDGKDKTVNACRHAIKPQIENFRLAAFFGQGGVVPCAITGEATTIDCAHVDHKPPKTFLSLVEDFLLGRGLTFDSVRFNPTVDGSTITRFADPELTTAWTEYHAQNAELQITAARANLQQGSGR